MLPTRNDSFGEGSKSAKPQPYSQAKPISWQWRPSESRRSYLSQSHKNETNVILIKHHIAIVLVRCHHQGMKHQGRHLTEGAIRASGLWLIRGERLISSIIHKSVYCRKLRGLCEHQFMSDLPEEMLQMDPPFSYVNLDVIGPWEVVTRRMRAGQVNNKRWAVLPHVCLLVLSV